MEANKEGIDVLPSSRQRGGVPLPGADLGIINATYVFYAVVRCTVVLEDSLLGGVEARWVTGDVAGCIDFG